MSPKLEYELAILPISVAALMNVRFVTRHLTGTLNCERVMIPGLCKGDLSIIEDKLGLAAVRGPKSLKDIPGYFGMPRNIERNLEGYGAHRVKIFAEIADAFEIGLEEILETASYFRESGADIIDLGCPVEGNFPGIEEAIKALKTAGFTVSLDSFNEDDILRADRAGVDFLLSVNSQNIDLARRLHCGVVVIPDFEAGLESLERNIDRLESWKIPYIIDPVLKPIGFGFTESIGDFITVRRNHPQTEMLMGLGNLTELTEADTTGMTAVMAGMIAELGIDYVLTTEVVRWAKGAVRELDIARRLMHYACKNRILPKHLNDELLTIKDPPFETFDEKELRAMQKGVRDRNFRIFADSEGIYVFNNRVFAKDADIGAIFERLEVKDTPQAFYLGREMEKASLARKLGKKYIQEEELRWGYLDTQTSTQGRKGTKTQRKA
jgi:dihydropteroate synthase-like protein